MKRMITEEDKELIKRLCLVVKATALSKQKFSNLAEIFNIGKKLTGKMKITESDISKVCRTFGVNYDWLKDGVGEIGNVTVKEKSDKIISFMPDTSVIREAPYLSQVLNILSSTGSTDKNNPFVIENASLREKVNNLNSIIDAKNETIRILMKILDDNGIKI